MTFRFTLEAVLRYRQSLEDRELLRLQAIQVQRATLLLELQQARDAHLQLQLALSDGLRREPTPAVEIQFSMARLNSIKGNQAVLQSRLEELQSAITQQTARYREERQKREILESLRERHLHDYRVAQQRRQQAMLDEMYLLRRSRKPA